MEEMGQGVEGRLGGLDERRPKGKESRQKEAHEPRISLRLSDVKAASRAVE